MLNIYLEDIANNEDCSDDVKASLLHSVAVIRKLLDIQELLLQPCENTEENWGLPENVKKNGDGSTYGEIAFANKEEENLTSRGNTSYQCDNISSGSKK